MKHFYIITFILLFICSYPTQVFAQEPIIKSPLWVYQTAGDYSDVREELLLAIENEGLVVSHIMHASDMLKRTRSAVGAKENIYSEAEIVLFCKADLSHKMVAANPHYLGLCPYSITIYTLKKQPKQVFLAIPAPFKAIKEYQPIHQLLQNIIQESIDF